MHADVLVALLIALFIHSLAALIFLPISATRATPFELDATEEMDDIAVDASIS
jgi:hypothetical protein